ncbi:dTDP-glucose 4,6-dehydratase [Rickettsiella endosymbiont of Miltochrista miniata]|uniref:dTDP-glucose 4,6-dehydratase n=1 Tax=Rickettsiella endosymbiont of Miltochrista miniata TaxID=3066239 RepID=UPI00313C9D4B
MTYTPRNILITGGAGFIASHFVHYYQTLYPEIFIINLDKLTYAGSLNHLKNLPYPDNHHFVQGDILDSQLVLGLLNDFKVDTVVHFAAETHVDRSINSPEKFIQTNISGTFALLDSCRKYWLHELGLNEQDCRFHHISTDEVYGSLRKDEPAFTELMPYRPNSPYSASKASSDYLVRAYYNTYGLPVSITNCSNNYGPLQHNEKFIPTIIDCCLRQKPIPVYGDGSNIRDWLYVEDHCRGIDRVIRNGKLGESYNIGGNTELTNLEVIQVICDTLNKIRPISYKYADLITFVKDRAGHDWRYAINTHKIKGELNWQPTETFSSGIIKTLSEFVK